MRLFESNDDSYFYVDDATNNVYVFDKKTRSLVQVTFESGGGGSGSTDQTADLPIDIASDSQGGQPGENDSGNQSSQGGGNSQDASEPSSQGGDGQSSKNSQSGKKDKSGSGQGSDKEDQSDSHDSGQQTGNSQDDKNKNGKNSKAPRIGDRGNKDIQDKEEAERLKKTGGKTESEEELADRLRKIEDILGSDEWGRQADLAVEKIRKRDQHYKDLRKAQLKEADPIKEFSESIRLFMNNYIDLVKTEHPTRPDPKAYRNGTYSPYLTRTFKRTVPIVNVYFDNSGSWGSDKIKIGIDALNSLSNDVRLGRIVLNMYLWNDDIKKINGIEEVPSKGSGGTNGQVVVNHIKGISGPKEGRCPDNVIIMTDSDTSDGFCFSGDAAEVQGGVWFLFCDGKSVAFTRMVLSKKGFQKYFEI